MVTGLERLRRFGKVLLIVTTASAFAAGIGDGNPAPVAGASGEPARASLPIVDLPPITPPAPSGPTNFQREAASEFQTQTENMVTDLKGAGLWDPSVAPGGLAFDSANGRISARLGAGGGSLEVKCGDQDGPSKKIDSASGKGGDKISANFPLEYGRYCRAVVAGPGGKVGAITGALMPKK